MGTIDMSAATAPPKRRSPNTRASVKAAAVVPEPEVSKAQVREAGMNGLAQMVMGACSIVGWYADAATINQFFPPVSHELAKIADNNETISKPIDTLIAVGPYGALLGVLLPFGMQVAANHGWIDASRLGAQGVMPPAVMEARAKAQMLEMAAEAQRRQNEALAAAREAQTAFEAALAEAQAV